MKTITIGNTIIELQVTTGVVLGASKNMETKVSGSGGGGFSYKGTGGTSNVRITSKTTVHDQIFLQNDKGKEHSYQLQDFNLACREGNTLSVISAFKPGKTSGPYIAVINHTTGKVNFSKEGLSKIAAPSFLVLGGIFLGVIVLGFTVTGGGFFTWAVLLGLALFAYAIFVTKKNEKLIKAAINPAEFNPMHPVVSQ